MDAMTPGTTPTTDMTGGTDMEFNEEDLQGISAANLPSQPGSSVHAITQAYEQIVEFIQLQEQQALEMRKQLHALVAQIALAPKRLVVSPEYANVATVEEAVDSLAASQFREEQLVQHQYGRFDNVQAAIAFAREGDTIVIRPGVYKESLAIDKPHLRIIGESPRSGDIVIEGTEGNALSCEVDGPTYFENISFVQPEQGKWYTVDIQKGQPYFHKCSFTSQSLASMAVRGRGTDPTIRACSFKDSITDAVFIYDGAKALFDSNEFSGNQHSGIVVKTQANPTIRNNRIFEQIDGSGIMVIENGGGIIEDNHIFKNKYAGIRIASESNPVVRRNRIYEQEESAGVYITDMGYGIIEDNQIYNNRLANVQVTKKSDPTIRRNKIFGSQKNCGVLITDAARSLIEGNDIHHNTHAGIQVRKHSTPTIRGNDIHHSLTSVGIFVSDDSDGAITENDVYENKHAGIQIKSGGNPEVFKNRIHHSSDSYGVLVFQGGRGCVSENHIYANKCSGVAIKTNGNPVIRNNKVYENGAFGLRVDSTAAGDVRENDCFDNRKGSIFANDDNQTLTQELLEQLNVTGDVSEASYDEGEEAEIAQGPDGEYDGNDQFAAAEAAGAVHARGEVQRNPSKHLVVKRSDSRRRVTFSDEPGPVSHTPSGSILRNGGGDYGGYGDANRPDADADADPEGGDDYYAGGNEYGDENDDDEAGRSSPPPPPTTPAGVGMGMDLDGTDEPPMPEEQEDAHAVDHEE